MKNAIRLAGIVFAIAGSARAEPSFCKERPMAGESTSLGRASSGTLRGAVQLKPSASVHVMPQQAQRCLDWSTPRMTSAIERAGADVASAIPGSPPLGVGDLSRAQGGEIRAYSKSHQSGRDADLAFFQLDEKGRPVAAEALVRFDAALKGAAADGARRIFDVPRNWRLVRALLVNPKIHVRWLFVSNAIRSALLQQAIREKTPEPLLARVSAILHQPSDAPPHDDHLHIRIACEADELAHGCRD
jgi:penicillin-insensitive murein endopeptidase